MPQADEFTEKGLSELQRNFGLFWIIVGFIYLGAYLNAYFGLSYIYPYDVCRNKVIYKADIYCGETSLNYSSCNQSSIYYANFKYLCPFKFYTDYGTCNKKTRMKFCVTNDPPSSDLSFQNIKGYYFEFDSKNKCNSEEYMCGEIAKRFSTCMRTPYQSDDFHYYCTIDNYKSNLTRKSTFKSFNDVNYVEEDKQVFPDCKASDNKYYCHLDHYTKMCSSAIYYHPSTGISYCTEKTKIFGDCQILDSKIICPYGEYAGNNFCNLKNGNCSESYRRTPYCSPLDEYFTCQYNSSYAGGFEIDQTSIKLTFVINSALSCLFFIGLGIVNILQDIFKTKKFIIVNIACIALMIVYIGYMMIYFFVVKFTFMGSFNLVVIISLLIQEIFASFLLYFSSNNIPKKDNNRENLDLKIEQNKNGKEEIVIDGNDRISSQPGLTQRESNTKILK